jgi:hypothetical protein
MEISFSGILILRVLVVLVVIRSGLASKEF